MPKALKNRGLQTRRRPTKRERHEWEAFLGLIPALAVAPAPVGLADQCRRVVGCWHINSICREDLREAGVQTSEGDLDLALARLVQEGVLAPLAGQPFCFQVVAIGKAAEPESAYAGEDATELKAAAMQEQSGRYKEMRMLEALLAGGRLSGRREERCRKDLAELGAVYAAQWLELDCAVGCDASEEVRRAVESLEMDMQHQMSLPFGVICDNPRAPGGQACRR